MPRCHFCCCGRVHRRRERRGQPTDLRRREIAEVQAARGVPQEVAEVLVEALVLHAAGEDVVAAEVVQPEVRALEDSLQDLGAAGAFTPPRSTLYTGIP